MTVDEVLLEIKKICTAHRAAEVYLFGSRAKQTALKRSDIDIAVSGLQDTDALQEELDSIPTLYKIDLVNLDTCKNELLKEDIRNYGLKI